MDKPFKPLSQLKHFFRLALERELVGSDQLIYLHIFNLFNEARYPETLQIMDAKLKDLLRLRDTTGAPASMETIRRGKQRLKAKGFIDFKSGKGNRPTEYQLIRLYPDDTSDSTPADTPADFGLVSYTHTREDSRLETETGRERRARAHEQADAGGIDNPKVAGNREESGNVTTSDDPSSHAPPNPLKSPEKENDIFKVWQTEIPDVYLNARQRFELAELAEDDFEKAKKAIVIMADTRQYKTFDAFKEKLDELKGNTKQKQPPLKGGEKNGKRRYSEEEPDPREKWEYSNR